MTHIHPHPIPDAVDPVCGMKTSPELAAAQAEFGGTTYYFCTTSCHERFTAAPQQYVETESISCCGSCAS